MTFAKRLAAVEQTRPTFTGTRFTLEGAFPYLAELARMSDDGGLELREPIRSDEMPDFVKWCQANWRASKKGTA